MDIGSLTVHPFLSFMSDFLILVLSENGGSCMIKFRFDFFTDETLLLFGIPTITSSMTTTKTSSARSATFEDTS